MAKELSPDEVCMTEGCGKKREWKGLCRSCYGQARRLIEKEETTWDQLEDMGLCVQDDKPFMTAFKKKRRELRQAAASTPYDGDVHPEIPAGGE